MAESFQPADKLKGFWEEKSPAAVTSVPFFQRAAPSPGNEGRKWAVMIPISFFSFFFFVLATNYVADSDTGWSSTSLFRNTP